LDPPPDPPDDDAVEAVAIVTEAELLDFFLLLEDFVVVVVVADDCIPIIVVGLPAAAKIGARADDAVETTVDGARVEIATAGAAVLVTAGGGKEAVGSATGGRVDMVG